MPGPVLPAEPTISRQCGLIIELAAGYRLAAVYRSRLFVEAGRYISCRTDQLDMCFGEQRLMSLLRGDKSADFQGRLPRIINRLINPETANTMMPPGLLVTNEVIELRGFAVLTHGRLSTLAPCRRQTPISEITQVHERSRPGPAHRIV